MPLFPVLKAGDTFTRDEFIKLVNLPAKSRTGSFEDQMRLNFRLIKAQQKINRNLRGRGLVLKSANYYTSFYVTDREESYKELKRYQLTSVRCQHSAATLHAGLTKSKSRAVVK